MTLKSSLLFVVLLLVQIVGVSQTSDNFKQIDQKNGFKDVVFGSSFASLKDKMGLSDPYKNLAPGDYGITKRYYQSIGEYVALNAIAHFVGNKLSTITLTFMSPAIINNNDERLKYLSDLFGTPVEIEGKFYWTGTNLYYCYSGVRFVIQSLKVVREKLENF